MGAALLLGNLRQVGQARLGLALVVGSAAIVVYNGPNGGSGALVFTPVLFALAWLVGFALRERAVQSEAAEERAVRAERERETAARVAVAEERGRIARELHDVVAHAVSVMVLQVGAVRHRMPRDRHRGPRRAAQRRAGRSHRARGDAAPAQRDAQRGRRPRAAAAPRARRPRRTRWPTYGRPAWPWRYDATASRCRCRPASTSRRTGSSRRASPTPSSTRTPGTPRSTCTTTPPASGSRSATTAVAPPQRCPSRCRPRPGRHRRAGQDLRRGDDRRRRPHRRIPAPGAAPAGRRR